MCCCCCSVTKSHLTLFNTCTAARQASLSFSISQSLLKLMFIEWVMPSNHLILCHPLFLASIFPSIRVFSNKSALCIRWPKYWNFSISSSNEYSGLISFRIDWSDLQGTLKSVYREIWILFSYEKEEYLPFATTWMELDSFMLSEISETEKEKYCVIRLICGILKPPPAQRVECWLLGVGGWDKEKIRAGTCS